MESLDKVSQLLDHYMDLPDEKLEPLLGPLPIAAARGMMPLLPMMMPDTAQELDEQIRGMQAFLQQLLSDEDETEPAIAAASDAEQA